MSALLFIFIFCATAVLTQDSRSSPEHYCYVKSPTESSIFNLTTIQHDHNDSTIRINEDEHLRIHFCRPLKDPCNGKQDYAVCLHDGTKEIGVGKEPPRVGIEFGKIMFRYVGDKCNESHHYTVDIEMRCNFSMKEKVAVDLDIIYSRDQCGFQMTIETSAACAKRKQTSCQLDDSSGYYDLSPLMNLARNYKVKINDTLSVILNVCHSLLYGEHFHQCNHDTMVCLEDASQPEQKIYKRLGNINDDVRISTVNGTVHLDLTSDTPCDDEHGNGLKTVTTTIEFVCKESATNKMPKYRSGFGTCNYKFRWQTVAACSEDFLIKYSEANSQPCKITDPVYSRMYDLSMLEGKVYYSNSSDKNAEYQFSVCSSLPRTNCTKSGTGVCKYLKDKKVGVSVGLGNTHLMWKHGRIFLNYTDGVACGNNQRRYTTIIFHCGDSNSLLVDETHPCATIITWSTLMVCNRRCSTSDYKINLEKLGRHSSNYLALGKSNLTQYYLNVCEPLVDEHFTNCTDDAGICKVIVDDQGKRVKEINLGIAESGVRRAEDGRVYLSYQNGSVCEEDSSRKISTEITFTCDVEIHAVGRIFFGLGEPFLLSEAFFKFLKIYQGNPTFKGYNDCKYHFDWKTGFSCDKFNASLTKGCYMSNSIEIFDLSLLIRNSLFKINRKESVGYFNVSVCGDSYKCNGTFVCDNKNYYGKYDEPTPPPTKNLVAFKFTNATKCKNYIFYNSILKLWCNVWAGLAESFLLNEGECSVELEWVTNHVCKSKGNVTVGEKERELASSPTAEQLIFAIVAMVAVIMTMYHFRLGYRRTMFLDVVRYYVNRYILRRRGPQPTEDLAL